MKTLIIALLFTVTVSAQELYEGTGFVTFQNDTYATIVFGRNGHAPSSFIVREPKLVEGKYYHFYLKTVKLNGTKENAKILLFHLDKKQIAIERRKFLDSINKKFIWI